MLLDFRSIMAPKTDFDRRSFHWAAEIFVRSFATGGENMRRIARLMFLIVILMSVSCLGHANTWTLANSNGGDGFVVATTTGFDLWGANNHVGLNETTYTFTASSAQNLSLLWVYTTHDVDGSIWDPAAYVLNGSFTILTNAGLFGSQSGTLNISLNPGDNFDFAIISLDTQGGRGDIAVTFTPEPVTLSFVTVGLLGLAARRHQV